MKNKEIAERPVRATPSIRSLVQAIFDSEDPELLAKSLPAQTLYSCIRAQGFESSAELIALASTEQMRTFLDFDLWQGDTFLEDNLIEWLSLDDDEGGLVLLQKVLKSLDLKLLAILICRWVTVTTFDQPNETPPGPGYYTPDLGYTWISIDQSDEKRHFVLARFLALLFETSAETFYQVLSIPTVSTPTLLEEDSFNEKTSRLSGEGVPDKTWSVELIRGSSIDKLLTHKNFPTTFDIQGNTGLISETRRGLQPLASLWENAKSIENLDSEMTLLLNAAIVRFNIPFFEIEQVKNIGSIVAGCINIGLELSLESKKLEPSQAYEALRLTGLFQAGMFEIVEVSKLCKKMEYEPTDSIEQTIIDALLMNPPVMPVFFSPDGSFVEEYGHLPSGTKAIEHLKEVEALKKWIKSK